MWESSEISQTTVPKLHSGTDSSTSTPSSRPRLWIDAYYLNAFDFRTGAALDRAHTGVRLGNDTHGAPVMIGPARTAYVGSIRGLLAGRDR